MLTSADLTVLLKALIAGAVGFAIGWERESHGHAAGIRTLALITMAAAIFTGIAQEAFPVPDRVVSTILAGVGFLGAGMILRDGGENVRGLTTAASVWAVTSVGIVIGTGHYLLGVMLALIILLLLWWQYLPGLSLLVPRVTRQKRSPAASPLTDHEKAA
jgi:putative Mg2+ transporter-C (MgtC) family protein